MNLKKDLKNTKAQALVEYVMIFTILVVAIVVVFGGFSLGVDKMGTNSTIGLKSVFTQAVNGAITQIQR